MKINDEVKEAEYVNDQTIGQKITMIKMEFAKVSRGGEEKQGSKVWQLSHMW